MRKAENEKGKGRENVKKRENAKEIGNEKGNVSAREKENAKEKGNENVTGIEIERKTEIETVMTRKVQKMF